MRSAYSTIVRDANDAAAALLDRHGRAVCQGENVPVQLGSMTATIEHCRKHVDVSRLRRGRLSDFERPLFGRAASQRYLHLHADFSRRRAARISPAPSRTTSTSGAARRASTWPRANCPGRPDHSAFTVESRRGLEWRPAATDDRNQHPRSGADRSVTSMRNLPAMPSACSGSWRSRANSARRSSRPHGRAHRLR